MTFEVSVGELYGESDSGALGGGVGCCEATSNANISVMQLRRAVEGVGGTTRVCSKHEVGRRSGPLVLVHWHTLLVGGVD